MTITFGTATVQRLLSERKIAEKLNNLRLYKISESLLLIHEGRSFGAIADLLHIGVRTVYHWLSHFLLRRFAWLCGHHYLEEEAISRSSIPSKNSGCIALLKKVRLPMGLSAGSGPPV